MIRINKPQKFITIAFLAFVAMANVKTLYQFDEVYNNFITNEWLINYEGGFVRRGLSGQLLLHAAGLTHIPLWILVFGLRALMYAAIAVLTIRKLSGRLSLIGWIFLLSPVTFLFEFYDLGGVGRKELLFLLFLATNSLLLENKTAQNTPLRPAYYGAVAFFLAAGILIHETFLFYLPLYLLQLASHGRLRQSRLLALPLAAALLAFAAVSAHKGSPATVELILHSLAPFVPGIACETNGGPICYLSSTTADALALVFVPEIGQLLLIPMLILLGYSALFLAGLNRAHATGQAGSSRDSGWLLLLALLALLPLFAVAVDYGRWIHVFVLGLFFALPRRALLHEDGAAPVPYAKTAWLLVVLFSLSWSVTHTRAANFQAGALGQLASMIPVAKLVTPPASVPAAESTSAPQAVPTHFAVAGAAFRWKGCKLPSTIGKPTGACSVEKRDRALAGHLTFGPYEPLPAGKYSLEIRYASPEAKSVAPGDWDVAIPLMQGSLVVARGQLKGSAGGPASISADFTIDAAQAMQPVEIRTATYAGKLLQIDWIELKRTR
jgi:hypothetical protein